MKVFVCMIQCKKKKNPSVILLDTFVLKVHTPNYLHVPNIFPTSGMRKSKKKKVANEIFPNKMRSYRDFEVKTASKCDEYPD